MKRPKDEVDYSRGHEDSHCGPWSRKDRGYCRHFMIGFRGKPYQQGACEKVAGPINPRYWCKLFKRATDA